jgi:hypothetical protein
MDQLILAIKILIYMSFKLLNLETQYNTKKQETLKIIKALIKYY